MVFWWWPLCWYFTHVIRLFPHLSSKVFNFGVDRSSCADVLRCHVHTGFEWIIYIDLVSLDAPDIEHWWNNDHEKISQFHGGRFFHGRSCRHVPNVLLFDALIPWISKGSEERRITSFYRDGYGVLLLPAMRIAWYICCHFGCPSFGNIRKARRKYGRCWSGVFWKYPVHAYMRLDPIWVPLWSYLVCEWLLIYDTCCDEIFLWLQ